MGLCCSNDYSVVINDNEMIDIYNVNKAKKNSTPPKEAKEKYQKLLQSKVNDINKMIEDKSNNYLTSIQINQKNYNNITVCDDATKECETHCKVNKYYQNKIIQDIVRIYDRNGYHAFNSNGLIYISWG